MFYQSPLKTDLKFNFFRWDDCKKKFSEVYFDTLEAIFEGYMSQRPKNDKKNGKRF